MKHADGRRLLQVYVSGERDAGPFRESPLAAGDFFGVLLAHLTVDANPPQGTAGAAVSRTGDCIK